MKWTPKKLIQALSRDMCIGVGARRGEKCQECDIKRALIKNLRKIK